MVTLNRKIIGKINKTLARGKSILLLGPRQVGKTTLLSKLAIDLTISLARPAVRQQYERNIESFSQEIEALNKQIGKIPVVAVDEVQKVPEIMDAVQDLIDNKIAQFILTGSSARKLKQQHQLNWLPGRAVYFNLGPLTIGELPEDYLQIEKIILNGTLPGIVLDASDEDREQDLNSYVVTYLEEEIRQEALVRKIGDFNRFLHLAAAESGKLANFSNISSDIGVAVTTVASYYQILEDCLIAERIEPFSKTSSTRRKMVKTCKYLFFDLGVRRAAAREGVKLPLKFMGEIFEQFVGIELLNEAKNRGKRVELNFWRDLDGHEVDWILNYENKILPIEVKWTENPTQKDARHLNLFIKEYNLTHAYIVCRCQRRRKITENVTAIPWQELSFFYDLEDR